MASIITITDELANALLAGGSLKELMENLAPASPVGGFISIYGGTMPASASVALTLTANPRLVKIAGDASPGIDGSVGLLLAVSAVSRSISKFSTQPWAGVNKFVGIGAGTATATFFRWHIAGDVDGGAGGSGVAGAGDYRIQGTVGAGGGFDLNLTSASITDDTSATTSISTFEVRYP